jgi:hypothetical protein
VHSGVASTSTALLVLIHIPTGQWNAFAFEEMMEVALEEELGAGRHGGWKEAGAATLNGNCGGSGGICPGPRESLARAGAKFEGGVAGQVTPLHRNLET